MNNAFYGLWFDRRRFGAVDIIESVEERLIVELKSSSSAQRLAISLVLIVAVEYFTSEVYY